MTDKTAIFAPHPDDETLGCGGTIAKRLSEGWEIFIVVMTDGRHGFAKTEFKDDLSEIDFAKIRRNETVKAVEILGVSEKNVIFLDFEDGKLTENSLEATSQVLEILDKLKPKEVFFPLEKDFHPDHKATSQILQNCLSKLNFPTYVYKYSISQRTGRLAPIFSRLENIFRHNLVLIDVSAFLKKKELAIRAYKSQVGTANIGQKTAVVQNAKRFLKRKEVFVFEDLHVT